MNPLLKKYRAAPRSAKWLVWTLGVVVVYFGVVEPVMTMTANSKAHADALAAGLERERALTSTDSDQGRTLANGRLSFGEPYLPDDPANKPEALHKAVDEILHKHDISKSTNSERHVRLGAEEASQLIGPLAATSSVERLILDISFEATPEVVTAVLADLEQAKEVAAVSRVEIRRQDAGIRGSAPSSSGSKIVKATISPEAWVITSASAPGGGFR